MQVKPGIWAQFTPRRSAYTLVLVVDDGAGGGDREGNIDAAKRKSEALFACAREPAVPAAVPAENPTVVPAEVPVAE